MLNMYDLRNSFMVVAISGLMLTASLKAEEIDTVVMTDGSVVSGRIETDNADSILIRDQMGGLRPLMLDQIKYVLRYYNNKKSWNMALDQLENENFEGALKYFLKVHENLNANLGVEESYKYAYLYTALSAHQIANKGVDSTKNLKVAARYYKKYVDNNPNGRDIRVAIQGAVDCFWAVGDTQSVDQILPVLTRIDAKGGALMKGRIALHKENWGDAISSVSSLARLGSVDAQMVLAKAQVGQGNLEEAQTMANAVIENESSEDVHKAQAFLVLGDVNRANALTQNEDESMKAGFKDALLEYLRVALLYSEQEKAAPEALYNAIVICEKLAVFKGESKFRSRKKVLTKMLMSKYASSPQAAMIK